MLVPHLLAATIALACPSNTANDLRVQPAGGQLITVEAASTRSTWATLRTWRRSGRCWQAVGPAYPARVGWNGLSANRSEGDGTTPAGTFRIHGTMYGNDANPGVRYRYVRIRCGDWWVEDARSPHYNTFRSVGCGVKPPFSTTSDGMWQDRAAYPYLAVVEFNMRPAVAGRGSGIFLHAMKRGATNGCISIAKANLRRVLTWLDPAAEPQIAIGTRASLT